MLLFSDAIWHDIITSAAPTLAALAALWATFKNRSLSKKRNEAVITKVQESTEQSKVNQKKIDSVVEKVDEVHKTVNGNQTALLENAKAAGILEGIEKAKEKKD